MVVEKLKVMFLCTGNSCRSQMAEGWARALKGGEIEAYSAGVEPHGINARAVKVMAEAGVDISGQASKHVDALKGVALDVVVTVCGHAAETCPVFGGATRAVHVGFEDPPALAKGAATEEEALRHYRRVRDEIRAWVETLPGSLGKGREMVSYGRRCLAELIGTFILVFAGTGAAVANEVAKSGIGVLGIGLVWGLVVMALIYAVGEVSGAHLNPAVTVGFWAARRFKGAEVWGYAACQGAGAVLASVLVRGVFPTSATLGATMPSGGWGQSFVLEIVLTAMLMFVAMCTATGSKEVGVMAGIAVGGVVALEAVFAGPVCGASMNPARSIGPAVVSGHLEFLWIYLAAPVIGALAGVLGWKGIRPVTASGSYLKG